MISQYRNDEFPQHGDQSIERDSRIFGKTEGAISSNCYRHWQEFSYQLHEIVKVKHKSALSALSTFVTI